VAPPQTPLRELTALPQAPKLDLRGRFAAGGGAGLGKRRERRGRGSGGE